MTMEVNQDVLLEKPFLTHFKNAILWLLVALAIGVIIGSVIALFLFGLQVVTTTRVSYPYLVFGLPFAGLLTGLIYFYFGDSANKGNNLLLEEYQTPSKVLPLKIAPLLIASTWLTHLFGGSAGREGTAIQVGATLSDQICSKFPVVLKNRRRIILMGIAAGFAATFGTPIAGFLFAIEIVSRRIKVNFLTLLVILSSAYTAHFVCLFWNIEHFSYPIDFVPDYSFSVISKISLCALFFGLTSRLFIFSTNTISSFFKRHIHYPPLVPFVGGLLFIVLYLTIGDSRFLGLGIPTIEESFSIPQAPQVFLLKILFTAITLGAGFKGGEVTPLFFIGVTLGSMLSIHLNLPLAFTAAIGFIAVFCGATKTPIACTFMGLELFGTAPFLFFLLTCTISYLLSGTTSIYNSQNHTPLWRYFLDAISKLKNN